MEREEKKEEEKTYSYMETTACPNYQVVVDLSVVVAVFHLMIYSVDLKRTENDDDSK